MERVKDRGREGVKLHRSREVAVVLRQGWSRIYPDPEHNGTLPPNATVTRALRLFQRQTARKETHT